MNKRGVHSEEHHCHCYCHCHRSQEHHHHCDCCCHCDEGCHAYHSAANHPPRCWCGYKEDRDDDDCRKPGNGNGNGNGGNGNGGGGDGTTVGWKNPNRPGRHCGTSTGELPGGQLYPGNFDDKPENQWPGQRGDLYLPFLFLRANPGDLGARPVVGPFWESPDILLAAGVAPSFAPPVPPLLGQTALAGRPNTVYAHVWNFGLAQAPCVVVEFYWCDPSLGIGPGSANVIGQATVALGARGSARSHALVKCPEAWTPTFVNGGHECLVVRVWDETSDGIGTPPWDAALNRHIGQRNIHVIAAAQPHAMALVLGSPAGLVLPNPVAPLRLKIGPLYGEPAQVTVERAAPHEMPWLQLHTGVRGMFPGQAAPTGNVLLSSPRPIGGPTPVGPGAAQHAVKSDGQEVGFTTDDRPPAPGQAHVYRVTASQQGQVFGGYTVVVLG